MKISLDVTDQKTDIAMLDYRRIGIGLSLTIALASSGFGSSFPNHTAMANQAGSAGQAPATKPIAIGSTVKNRTLIAGFGIGSFLHHDGDKGSVAQKNDDDIPPTPNTPPAPAARLQIDAPAEPKALPSDRQSIEMRPAQPVEMRPAQVIPTADMQAMPAKVEQPVQPQQPAAVPQDQTQRISIPLRGAEPSQVIAAPQNAMSDRFEMPSYLPDNALISVLRDIARTLKEPAELEKVTDLNQRAVLRAARQILNKALESPDLSADRFVHDRKKSVSTMSIEAWASGDVRVSEQSRGSLSAVWAKHENGLINISIAGNSNDKTAPNGRKIGEYVVFISAKSPIEKGFDIQTQNEVDFWIGKLASITIECASSDEQAIAATPAGPPVTSALESHAPVLQAIVTQRGRQYLATADDANPNKPNANKQPAAKAAKPGTVNGATVQSAVKKPATPPRIINAVPPAELIQLPSAEANVVAPDRVIAGQAMTASIVGGNGAIEPYVALNFNGALVYTDKKGQALYAVPDDATPGHSLGVKFAERPESPGAAVEVIQPLGIPTQQQAPKMDRIALFSANRFAVIDGHNFDGIAGSNRVTLDGLFDAKVLSASPVQIKVQLPVGVHAGSHIVIVTVANLRSAPVAFKAKQ